MSVRSPTVRPGAVVSGFGLALLGVAVAHHALEVLRLDRTLGPALALAIDATPFLVLGVAGVRLQNTRFPEEHRWSVAGWTVGGAAVFALVVTLSLVVRIVEGRAVTEPVFSVLLVTGVGGVAGYVAGHFHARARTDADRAERATEALALVNGVLRHDLRNDLNVVEGYAEVVADDLPADADEHVAEATETIRAKAAEATDRIATTGAIAGTFVGDADLERIDLAGIVTETAARLERTSGVAIETDVPEKAPVRADEGLRSVVDNLLENAVEHADAADPRATVTVESAGETVRLTVADDGPGIPEDERGDLFAVGPDASSASGLALVRLLVEHYGGSVTLEDGTHSDDGATFVVRLPHAESVASIG